MALGTIQCASDVTLGTYCFLSFFHCGHVGSHILQSDLIVLFSSRSKSQALSAVEVHYCRRETGNQIGKIYIRYQIRKSACILAENRKQNAKKRKNRKPQQTPKPINRSFSVKKTKYRSKKWPKPQNQKSQHPECSV